MNKLRSILASTAVGLCLASCSILNGEMPVIKRPVKQGPSAKQRVEQVLQQTADQDTASVAEPAEAPPASKLIGKIEGEWVIIEAGGKEIRQDDDMPYLIIEERTGRFYASNGCNILNGNFAYEGVNGLAFSHVLSTMMACPDIDYEHAINSVVRDGSSVKVDIQAKGNEWYMRMRDAGGQVLMVLRKHNVEAINGQWDLVQINEEDVDIPDANIFFDIPELTVHGNTGCNHFNGIILIDPQVANSISFARIGATMRMCHNSDYETAMLVALEQTTNYHLASNRLILLDSQGSPLLTFHRPAN